MNNKKDIEQIFQEKLKDFEATPPSESWDFISEKLQEKEEKKRIIPILWFKTAATISSIAALVILGLFLFRNDEKSSKNNHEITSNSGKKSESKPINYKNSLESNSNQKSSEQLERNPKKEIIKESKNDNSNTFATNQTLKENGKSSEKHLAQKKIDLAFEKDKNKGNTETNSTKTDNKTTLENTNNQNIALEKMQRNDSLVLAKNEPENNDVLNKKIEKEIKKAKKENKFSVSAFAAPVLAFSSGGSAIDQKLDNNKNVYNDNLSFGVNADYAITEKIKLRSGIHYLNLNNNTKNINFVKTSIASLEDLYTLKNVSPNNNLNNIIIANYQVSADLAAYYGMNNLNNGEIRQELSFIEVPFEISYPLYSKRLKISSVTGFSTYFLEKNKIFLMSANGNTEIGKANNINNIHYSGNVGFNFQYLLKGKYNLFLEPVFKYQINTYQSETTNVKPYFIGIYTGFVYQF